MGIFLGAIARSNAPSGKRKGTPPYRHDFAIFEHHFSRVEDGQKVNFKTGCFLGWLVSGGLALM